MARVRDFMTTGVMTVDSSAELVEAARLMRDCDVGVLPVMQDGRLRGMVTDRDIVTRALASGKFKATVGEILTEDLVCLSPDDDEKEAQKRMSDNDVRRLPVVEDGKVVGMVSVGDLAVRRSDKLAGKVMEETGPDD